MNDNDLIVKSNYLIQAKYKLTLMEQRIMYLVLSKIQKDDDELKIYDFTVKEFMEKTEVINKKIYADIATAAELLRNRDLTFIKDGIIERFKWVSYVKYFNDHGHIELGFDPRLKPYLLQLKEEFTKLSLNRMLSFNSIHSGRIYELLKQYEKIGSRKITVAEVKEFLGLEPLQYNTYAEFKRRILNKTKKEISETSDISFDFEEIKDHKRIVALKFIIRSKKEIALTSIDENEELKTLRDKLKDDFNNSEINAILKVNKDINEVLIAYEWFKNAENVKNKAAYMISLVQIKDLQQPLKKEIKLNIKKSKRTNANFEQRKYTKKDFEELEKNLLSRDDEVDEEDCDEKN